MHASAGLAASCTRYQRNHQPEIALPPLGARDLGRQQQAPWFSSVAA